MPMAEACSTTVDNAPGRRPGLQYVLKFVFVALLAGLAFAAPTGIAEISRTAMSDAYIAVSTFVAMTLAIFYILEHGLKLDTDALLLRYKRWHIPIAAFLGVTPGCGGAIIVITQYVTGRIGFGSVVAVLTATMGDAAFLLLARDPMTALLVFSICFVAGVVSGLVVEAIHGEDFLKQEYTKDTLYKRRCGTSPKALTGVRWLWLAMMLPGLALGLGNAFQADTNLWFGPLAGHDPTLWAGVFGAMLAAAMWALMPNAGPASANLAGPMTERQSYRDILDRVAIDTNFVTVWVIGAFLLYELIMYASGFDLADLFSQWQPILPLMGVLIGFLPGCGPQVMVTTFYLDGLIPLSAQLGNAISNDGDALFPAIALAPRAAVLATIYTAVPAVIVAYGWYFLVGT